MGDLVPLTTPPPAHRSRQHASHTQVEPLWREVVGAQLRRRRLERGERLSDTAGRAGVSLQYLSEIERGRKDASSEVLAAVAGALDLRLGELTQVVSQQLEAGPLRGPVALAA